MFGDPTLYLVEQISQLHTNYQWRHAEKNVAPQEHVNMLKKVDRQYD